MTDPFALSHVKTWDIHSYFESCPSADTLLINTLSLTNSTRNLALAQLSQEAKKQTSIREKKRQTLFLLAQRSILAGNMSSHLVTLMNLYEERLPDQSIFDKIADYFKSFVNYFEEQLPPCQFQTEKPLHRERFVVCKQMVNFFSSQMAAAIAIRCQDETISLNDPLETYKNFGTYLVAAENKNSHALASIQSSWGFRSEWHSLYKENFCKTADKNYWEEYYCKNPKRSWINPQDQNLQYWKNHIYMPTTRLRETYTSKTQVELDRELDRREKIFRRYTTRSEQLFSNMTIFFKKEILTESNKRQNAIQEVYKSNNLVLNARQAYEESLQKDTKETVQEKLKAYKKAAKTFLALAEKYQIADTYPLFVQISKNALKAQLPDDQSDKLERLCIEK